MSVLIVKNVTAEGPGTIEDHLRSENIPFALEISGPYRDRAEGFYRAFFRGSA